MNRFYSAAIILAGLAFAPVISCAQSATATVAYTGPRYPGGPDSLRALVARSMRQATGAPAVRMLIQFDMLNGETPANYRLIPPPAPVNPAATEAANAALAYLQAHMPDWQAGAPVPADTPPLLLKTSLVLDFATPEAALPYAYADQLPSAPEPKMLAKAQRNVRFPLVLDYSPRGLKTFVQRQSLYPPAALRQQVQGTVCAYFEVAENGAIEHPAIVGTVTQSLDNEVLRVLQNLPNATVSAMLHGKAVRVYYVLPITFIIQ